ncbi:hypothetical protein ABVT39_016790, partial [Epinephelus coioides]
WTNSSPRELLRLTLNAPNSPSSPPNPLASSCSSPTAGNTSLHINASAPLSVIVDSAKALVQKKEEEEDEGGGGGGALIKHNRPRQNQLQ